MEGFGRPFAIGPNLPFPAPLPEAALAELPGCLVISHSQRVHRRIVDFFEQLRRLPQVNP